MPLRYVNWKESAKRLVHPHSRQGSDCSSALVGISLKKFPSRQLSNQKQQRKVWWCGLWCGLAVLKRAIMSSVVAATGFLYSFAHILHTSCRCKLLSSELFLFFFFPLWALSPLEYLKFPIPMVWQLLRYHCFLHIPFLPLDTEVTSMTLVKASSWIFSNSGRRQDLASQIIIRRKLKSKAQATSSPQGKQENQPKTLPKVENLISVLQDVRLGGGRGEEAQYNIDTISQ